MIASSWSMSARCCSRASSSLTLISASRRRRASGVRRSCEMPASITARSSSTLASSRAMRLKPMLTSRISLVIGVLVEAAGVELAVADAAGGERQLLQRLVDEARDRRRAAATVASSAIDPDEPCAARHQRTRCGSTCSQYGSLSIRSRPTGRASALTELPPWCPGPAGLQLVASMRRREAIDLERLAIVASARAAGCAPTSWSVIVLISDTRLMPSA